MMSKLDPNSQNAYPGKSTLFTVVWTKGQIKRGAARTLTVVFSMIVSMTFCVVHATNNELDLTLELSWFLGMLGSLVHDAALNTRRKPEMLYLWGELFTFMYVYNPR